MRDSVRVCNGALKGACNRIVVENLEKRNGEPPVVLRGLHKSFGAQVVLNGIDLTVARGETLAVLGRSGTGKSVLLKIIIGLQKPDAGSVSIHGQEIIGINLDKLNEIRKKMFFVPAGGALRLANGGGECGLSTEAQYKNAGVRAAGSSQGIAGECGHGRRSQEDAFRYFGRHAEASRAGAGAGSRPRHPLAR
jgi:hypothetical protein